MTHKTKARYLNTKHAADYLGVSLGTLKYWRVNGKGPRYSQESRRVFYDPADLDEWVKRNSKNFTGEIKEE